MTLVRDAIFVDCALNPRDRVFRTVAPAKRDLPLEITPGMPVPGRIQGEDTRRRYVQGRLERSIIPVGRSEDLDAMTQHRYETDETFSALFGLHDRIHELTKEYLQEVLRSRGELDERVRMLSTVLDSIGDGLTILDKEGKVIFVSETARRTVRMGSEGAWLEQLREHYSAYEADGKTVIDRAALVRDVLERRKAPIEKDCLVVGDLLPSGGLWIRIKSTPVFDDAGNVSGAVNILHNITDLKLASERIHAL